MRKSISINYTGILQALIAARFNMYNLHKSLNLNYLQITKFGVGIA